MHPALALAAFTLAAPMPTTDAERQQFVAHATHEELTAFVRETPPEALLAMSLRAIKAYDTYTYTMAKQERVRGTLLDTQVIHVTTRESPFAVRLDFISGPAKGRVVIFNRSVREKEFRVAEPGFLSFIGPIWLPINSSLSKSDSNYTIDRAGLGNLVKKLQGEVALAATLGGLTITDEGWNGDGQYCQLYVMPHGGKGFDAPKSRICIDLQLGVPGRVESFTTSGELIGRFVFTDLKASTSSLASLEPSNIGR